ncbi:uncharacterized protein im:7147486 [Megalobrama amblycephala]|uniref:uncharacterized protein im:7147486 n=1 Tax=Megalobrama amblycephala TaxID=75352 RepID=UPI002013D85E|nr:uncharacterized protein im:7147486 [Megalobrama amblycephala]
MLGLQETKSAGSPKTYSCVACSATFHNLSSLLVHQATHASEISCQTESTLPTCINCGSLFASKDLLEKHHCTMSASPNQNYICECGEEFSGFTALEDHKKQHGPENKDKSDLSRIHVVPDSKIDSNHPVSNQVFHSLSPSYSNEKSLAESAPPISNADIKKTESSADMESSILKPVESHSVTEVQVQILEKGTIKSSTMVVEEQVQINEMDTLKSSGIVREEQVQIYDMDTLKSSDVEGEEQMQIRGTDTSKSSNVVEEEQVQIFEMDTLKSFDVVGEEKVQILYMDTLKSSNVVGEEQVQILEKDTLKSSDMVGEDQVQILEKDTLKSSNLVGEDQVQILEKDTLNHSVHDNEKSPESCGESTAISKKSILKMLASAYMSHKQPVQMKQRNLPPRKVAPRAPLQPATAMTISKPEPLENQSKMKKDTVVSVKTGKMSPKKGKIISVTQTLCPVVVLETRQKLFGRDNVEGKLQCRLCRRVFQNVDSLIMHHALHKKERVKFCLCCQQFVITVISVPENHVCSDAFSRNSEPLGKTSVTPNSPIAQQIEKMFYCSLCKRGYTRRHRLKIHNCPYKASLKSSPTVGNQGHFKLQKMEVDRSKSQKQDSKTNQMSTQHINIGVGTEPVKIEEQNTEFSIDKQNQAGLKMQLKDQINPVFPVKSIFASVSNSKPTESSKNSVEVPANMVEMKAEEKDKLVEKQWTMPLDDAEIDILIDVDQNDSDEDDLIDMAKDDCDDDQDVEIVELPDDKEINPAEHGNGFQVHVTNKGVKRFVCNDCQRSYSRLFTLKEHLKICEARKLEQTVENASSDLPVPAKRFPCPRCGKFISRKDNLNKHVKKCQGTNTNSVISSRTVESKTTPTAQENLFVLSPSTENPAAQQESTQNTSSSRNWGIMSLPSVLPRRVTCECGASFTCPRLLFEHLQVHAQESYICPHCGENLQSWMDFEAHQQLHNKSKIPANEQRGSQQQPRSFSQTVPSRAPTRPQQSTGFSALNIKAQPPALLSPQHVNHRSFPETWSCHKCKKNFSLRSSLLRHIRLRCKGDTAGQKKHNCSRCGAMFHNPVTLKVHIQSNTCKPAFKPIRCPVCVRWFSCLDGLKRHLVSHSRQAGVTCQICDHNCPTPQALEEHKRNVHGVFNRMRPAEDTQEQLSQAGTQSSLSTPTPTPFQCPICLRSYPKLQSLKDHLRKVHRPKQPNLVTVEPVRSGQFQCQICSRSYFDIKSLKNHRRRVHRIVGTVFQPSKGTEQNSAPNQFQCHICARSYPDVQSLRNHRRRVHRIVGGLELSRGMAQHNLYKCQICQRSYPDIVSLKNHTRRVHRILGPVPETSTTTTNDTEDDLEQKPIPFLHS